MTRLLPLLFLAACIPEPVSLPPNGVSLPLRVCDDRAVVQQAVRHVNIQIRGAIVNACPGTVTFDLAGAECPRNADQSVPGTCGVADWEHGYCHVTLVRVGPFERSWVLSHELGHCLGLADDDRNTQMSNYYDPENLPSDRFSDRDRRYVRGRLP